MRLNREAREPLHRQLSQILSRAIEAGTYPREGSLPSEFELQSTFAVSRSVVRQALESLVRMGLIERTKGSGSRVTRAVAYHRLALSQMGLAAQLTAGGAATTTTVTAFELLVGPIPEFTAEATGTLLLERVRAVEGIPIAFIRTWLPVPLCSTLTAQELENASLHEIMSRKYALTFTGGHRRVGATAADAQLASILDVADHSPLLLLEGISTDGESRVLEKFATWHRADLISLDFSLG